MATVDTLLTVEDLYAMPDDGVRRELIRGRLIEMSPGGGLHGYVIGRVTLTVGRYTDEHRLGVLLVGDPGIVLEHAPDTVRAPDNAYYTTARWAQVTDPERYLEVIPDLVVEVVSPSDRLVKVREKAAAWRLFGVPLIWAIDRRRSRITVFLADGSSQVKLSTDEIDGADVIPGFRCSVASLLD